jgi:hypothetical protein
MAHSQYTYAEAEQNFLRFSGILSCTMGLNFMSDAVFSVYNPFQELTSNIALMAGIGLLSVLFSCFAIYAFYAMTKSGIEMRKRSFLRFKFDDEYVSNLSKSAEAFAGGIGAFCLFVSVVMTHKSHSSSALSSISIHEFSRLILGVTMVAYSLPILASYWKRDE